MDPVVWKCPNIVSDYVILYINLTAKRPTQTPVDWEHPSHPLRTLTAPGWLTLSVSLCWPPKEAGLTLVQGLKLCVFWHKVCSWLCWSVLCKVAKWLEIVEKMNRFALLNFKIFWGNAPRPDPHTGEGLRRPSPDPTPSALRRFAPPCLARGLRPLHRPSLYVVDILRYLRPCSCEHYPSPLTEEIVER